MPLMPGRVVALRGPCGACPGRGGMGAIPGGICGIWSEPMTLGAWVWARGGMVGGDGACKAGF